MPSQIHKSEIKSSEVPANSEPETTQIFTIEPKYMSSTVTLPLLLSCTKSASLLVDTGSAVSILKLSKTDGDAFIDTENSVRLKGITENFVTTLGVCIGEIQLAENIFISNPFHIVPDDFPIPTDGIIGKDLLSQHNAVIDYNLSKISFQVQNTRHSFILTCPRTIEIPARTEMIARINSTADSPRLCLQKEIEPGLYIANSIIDNKNPLISILNANEHSISFNLKDIEYDDLENYHIINFVENTGAKRLKLLESEIQTEHLNSEERQSILEICREFNDIFHLEGDKLTLRMRFVILYLCCQISQFM